MATIAIIGAGMAGLACAQRLTAAGRAVTLFDKGRGPGGRLATRRVETPHGVLRFDHGAQYLTVRDRGFRASLARVSGAIAPWPESTGAPSEERFVGAPGMNALPKALAKGLDVRFSSRIARLRRAEGGWTLDSEDGARFGPFAAVLVAVPAEQAGALVAPHSPAFAAEAAAARTAPCWAGLFAVQGQDQPPLIAQRLKDHPVLAWIACDSAKPGRDAALQTWVLHARTDWSADHLEETPETILTALQEAFEASVRPQSPILFAQAHRWRFAQVTEPAATPFAWDKGLGLGLCGDWRIGPRVEAAWQSGDALARAVLKADPC